jgi:HlyD family secretion protein
VNKNKRFLTMQKGRAGLLAIAAGVLVSGFVIATAPQHTPKAIVEKSWSVTAMQVLSEPLSAQLKLYGRVETPHKVELSAAVTAQITKVYVDEGQIVREGDLLVQLDASEAKLTMAELEAGVLDAKAQLASLNAQQKADRNMLAHQQKLSALTQAKLKRHQRLASDHLISAESLDDFQRESQQQAIELERQRVTVENIPHRVAAANAQLQRAKALLGQAQLNLQRTRIYAPFDGAVTELLVAAGDRVNIGRGLIRLYDTHAMEVRAAITARHLPELRAALNHGEDVVAHVSIDNQRFSLKLAAITAAVNTTGATVDGIFRFQNTAVTPMLGRVVNLQVTLPVQQGLIAVPAQAVYDSERVYVIEDERLVAVDIDLAGEMEDSNGQFHLLISTEQLKAGQLLMTSQLAAATTGLKVNVNTTNQNIGSM